RNLGITFVFITHDQEEAMSMSDRIAVMNKGKIEQLGTPEEIYYQPKSLFVATFIGENNIIEDQDSIVALRPERITVSDVTSSSDRVGIIEDTEFLGNHHKLYIRDEKTSHIFIAYQTVERNQLVQIGKKVGLHWNQEDEVILT